MFLNEGHHSNTVNVIPSHLKIVLLLPSSLLASIKNLYFLWAYNNIEAKLKNVNQTMGVYYYFSGDQNGESIGIILTVI